MNKKINLQCKFSNPNLQYLSWHNARDEKIAKDFQLCVEKYLSISEKILEGLNDKNKKISDQEFLKSLEQLFFIYLDEEKYLELFSEAFHKKFIGYTRINTNVLINDQKTEGHGKNFSWWIQRYRLIYKVMYTKDAQIDEKHYYTNSEIEKLINENKIIIVDVDSEYWDNMINSLKEKYKSFKSYIIDEENLDKKSEYYKYVSEYIRNNIDIPYTKKYIYNFLTELQRGVKKCLNHIESKDKYEEEYYNDIADLSSKNIDEIGFSKRLNTAKMNCK